MGKQGEKKLNPQQMEWIGKEMITICKKFGISMVSYKVKKHGYDFDIEFENGCVR